MAAKKPKKTPAQLHAARKKRYKEHVGAMQKANKDFRKAEKNVEKRTAAFNRLMGTKGYGGFSDLTMAEALKNRKKTR